MSRAAKKAGEPEACRCADEPASHGALWKCCVCTAWNGQQRKACVNCHHERGGERIALRWNPPPSEARFAPKGKP